MNVNPENRTFLRRDVYPEFPLVLFLGLFGLIYCFLFFGWLVWFCFVWDFCGLHTEDGVLVVLNKVLPNGTPVCYIQLNCYIQLQAKCIRSYLVTILLRTKNQGTARFGYFTRESREQRGAVKTEGPGASKTWPDPQHINTVIQKKRGIS